MHPLRSRHGRHFTRGLHRPVEALERRDMLAAGDLDTAFASGGFALADFGVGTAYTNDVAVDAGRERILVAGSFIPARLSRAMIVAGKTSFGALAAFKLDGTPDPTFSSNGEMLTDLRGLGGLQVLADGRFYAVGTRTAPPGSPPPARTVARFNPDGSYDTRFSGDGKLDLPFDGFVAASSDGKVVVVGGQRVARFNADGTPDTTLGGDGDVSAVFGPGDFGDNYLEYQWYRTEGAAVQDDGKIVIVGTAFSGEEQWDGAAMRLNPGGSFDSTFGEDGRLILVSGSVDDYATDVALGNGGDLFFGEVYTEYRAYPARYNPADPTPFRVTRPIEAEYVYVADTEVASDGRVFVTAGHGEIHDYAPPPVIMAAYMPDGQFQPGFGGNAEGQFTHPVGWEFALDPDDRLLVVPADPRADGALAVARYLDEGGEAASGAASLSNGRLTITGTGRGDEVRVTPAAGGKIAASVNGYRREFDAASVTSVRIDGLAGDDDIDVDPLLALPSTLNGGDGIDSLTGGAGNDHLDGGDTREHWDSRQHLYGGAGNDTLVGGAGRDLLFGGDGDDSVSGGDGSDYLVGGAGADDLSGGAGDDWVSYQDRTGDLVVTLDNRSDDGEAGERDNVRDDVENVTGGGGDDRIVGSSADNEIRGEDGNDTLIGGAGNDSLRGWSGDDLLEGGDGDDTLWGSNSGDTLRGGAGIDDLTGGDPADVDGGPGLDVINGVREDGVPTYGPIRLDVRTGVLHVDGMQGDDEIRVVYVPATATAPALLRATVRQGPHSSGNGGTYAADVPAADVSSISVYTYWGDNLVDLTGVPVPSTVNGGPGRDTVFGGEAADLIEGDRGDDRLFGNGGGDTLLPGHGTDFVSGGAGTDAADYSDRTDDLILTLNNRADDGGRGERDDVRSDLEVVYGGSGNDRIAGSAADDRLYGGAGNDTLSGGGGRDQLRGNDGNDTLHARGDGAIDFLDGGGGNDRATKDGEDFAQYVEQILA